MKNLSFDAYGLFFVITIFFIQASCQNICNNCITVTNMTSNFTCNNMYCSGFAVQSDNQYNFNSSSVMCNQANGANGGSNCFYVQSITNQSVTYFFCNASINGCASCTNQNLCTTCFNGYYLYNLSSVNVNCQSCSGSIPGCMYCNSQSSCTQCQSGFVLYNSNCAYINGTLPRGLGIFTYEKGGSTTVQIVIAVFIFCILVIAGIAVFIFFYKQKKQVPDFLNPALINNPTDDTLAF